MIFKGVSLDCIIHVYSTGERFSASRRAYELFGTDLIGSEELSIRKVDWCSVMVKSPEVYLVVVVDWNAGEVLEAKGLIGKESEFAGRGKLKEVFEGDSDDKAKVLLQSHFLQCLEKNNGMLARSFRDSKVSRSVYAKWLQTDSDFSQAIFEIRETVKDDVEGALITQAKNGDGNSQRFFLEKQSSDRGYGKLESSVIEDKSELDLSLLSYAEQTMLQNLVEKATPKMIGMK